MLSVLVAAAPRGIPPGFTGALLLLVLGMGVVFLVLTGLTAVMWVIGKVARDRPAADAKAEAKAVEPAESQAVQAEVAPSTAPAETPKPSIPEALSPCAAAAVASAAALESSAARIPRGGPLTPAEIAAVGTAVALEGSGASGAEVAAITTALACRAGGAPSGERIRVVHEVEEPGSGAWGSAAFAGRSGASMPAQRRG